MAFKKGHKKVGGRKPGKANKVNEFPRQVLIDILAAQGDKPLKELASLSGKDYIECFDKIMKYILPTLKAVEISGDENKPPPPFQFIIQRQEDDVTD